MLQQVHVPREPGLIIEISPFSMVDVIGDETIYHSGNEIATLERLPQLTLRKRGRIQGPEIHHIDDYVYVSKHLVTYMQTYMSDYDRDTAEHIITDLPAKRLRAISSNEERVGVPKRKGICRNIRRSYQECHARTHI